LAQVLDPAQRYAGAPPVRWGGRIVRVENKANDTWIEVIAKELDGEGRPIESDQSAGRFLVRVEGFLDPAVYQADREVTVYGVVETKVDRTIGERPYTYPMIRAQRFHLWEEEFPERYGYDPWYPRGYFYDPFYYPYWPYSRLHGPLWW
jgi:outer membrane lipoprotein